MASKAVRFYVEIYLAKNDKLEKYFSELVLAVTSSKGTKMASSRKKLRSRCPVGFEPVVLNDSRDCPVLEELADNENSSLWLIKVPHDFDLSSLSGHNIVLNGSQDLLPNGIQNTGKRYEVQSKTDSSAEPSSFTVLLPSLQQRSLCVAGSVAGQMSVIRSVPVPPPTLPESSLSVQGQPPTEFIRKWKPFGYKKPRRKLRRAADKMSRILSVKEEKNKEQDGSFKDGCRKRAKERKAMHIEESMDRNKSGRNKRDSPKKKKKDDGQHDVDLRRVKTEPDGDASYTITATNGEQSSHSPRKRKAEKNKTDSEDLGLTTSENKKKRKPGSMDKIVKKEPVMPDENSPRHYRRHQNGVTDMGELTSLNQKTRVKTEPRESHQKKKRSKTKTH